MENTNKLYTLYVGSNNKTGKLELEKALSIVNEYYTGYTYTLCNGVWQGVAESTLKLEIVAENVNYINFLIESLKKVLKQKSIMLVTSDSIIDFK